MKTITTTFILIIGLLASVQAQTHEIAHKSHSGSLASIDRSGPERFGAIESPPLMRIERIQTKKDTATILYFGYSFDNTRDQYRVENHPIFNNPNLNVDSLKASYEGTVELVGFDEEMPLEQEKKKHSKKEKKQWLLPLTLPSSGTALRIALLLLGLLTAAVWSTQMKTAIE